MNHLHHCLNHRPGTSTSKDPNTKTSESLNPFPDLRVSDTLVPYSPVDTDRERDAVKDEHYNPTKEFTRRRQKSGDLTPIIIEEGPQNPSIDYSLPL